MLHHLLDHNMFEDFTGHDISNAPVNPHDFEFFNVKNSPVPEVNVEDILLEIGQKIFKHNYMKNIYGMPMLPPNILSNLYIELQALIRCHPTSPSGILLELNTTRCKVDTENLFRGRWPSVRSMLDFIGKIKPEKIGYLPFGIEDDDEHQIYENMFR